MTMLQNSLILDEEYEYEVSVLDLWKAKGIEEPYDAISLALKTFIMFATLRLLSKERL